MFPCLIVSLTGGGRCRRDLTGPRVNMVSHRDAIQYYSGGDMLQSIKRYFSEHLQQAALPEGDLHAVRLATTALLVEAMYADGAIREEERRALENAVVSMFKLAPDESGELIRLAEGEVKDATCLFQFTSLVDQHFPLERKVLIIELLWRVVFSDASNDKHEEHLVRRIADLLHVPHREFVRTRHLVASGHGNSAS